MMTTTTATTIQLVAESRLEFLHETRVILSWDGLREFKRFIYSQKSPSIAWTPLITRGSH